MYARGGLSEVLRDEERSESRRIEREKKRPCCADRKYRKAKEEEREKEGKRGPDRTFLPRTGPRQNVIMLIRDWFENVKCTRQSTAGYHEPPSIGFLSHSLSAPLSSLSFFLSSISSTDIYGIFFIAPATFRFARSYLVSSCLEEAPETRNVSISVTIDGVPSRVSSRLRTLADSTYVTRPDLQHVIEYPRR